MFASMMLAMSASHRTRYKAFLSSSVMLVLVARGVYTLK